MDSVRASIKPGARSRRPAALPDTRAMPPAPEPAADPAPAAQPRPPLFGADAYAPREIAARVQDVGVAKAQLPPAEAFFRGVLCKVLVCMAVWMAMAGRSVLDKIVAVVFPVTAFVAAGFEHSIANLHFFPLAALLGAPITLGQMAGNLVPVIAGNIVGGSVLVALVYWVTYLRPVR
jgi:formate/nitrite transporter